jgi:thiamine-phosphate pyrophosphorylase
MPTHPALLRVSSAVLFISSDSGGFGGVNEIAQRPPNIVLVTDRAFCDDIIMRCVHAVAVALPYGALAVQLRDKSRPLPSLRLFALQLRDATRRLGAFLVINGDPHLARDVDADGIHLGRGQVSVRQARAICRPGTWVSVAAHSDDEVCRAREDGADAALVSPIFATRSASPLGVNAMRKQPRGVTALRSARDAAGAGVRLYALGGITVDRAIACKNAGADGVAVIRALLCADDPARVARGLFAAWGRC